MNIEYLGKVKKIHTSGMVETDKGHRYPYTGVQVGHVMAKVDGERKFFEENEWKELNKGKTKPPRKKRTTKEVKEPKEDKTKPAAPLDKAEQVEENLFEDKEGENATE